ncbi:hypothetical protein [Marivita sp. GX14005]|uniref:hypothetical protein n=1 Tax=Marivita sp. GX14005 TaxID=2942276 RepID=UPI00201A1F41|nr:hypothetical protein [Marivita sp. GX14005]MCL3881284.1 hypothetical protein [Marivita sp. GX14005]
MSLAFVIFGLVGAIALAASTVAMSSKMNTTVRTDRAAQPHYPSLLLRHARDRLSEQSPDPVAWRAGLIGRLAPDGTDRGFVTREDQIGMILSQIIARWSVTDPALLSDDQVRELWLTERLLRADPAQAGELATLFVTPGAMLAMRDLVAEHASA